MRRISLVFVLFYFAATVAVSADRTMLVIEEIRREAAANPGDTESPRIHAYPRFREGQEMRFLWADLAVAITLESLPPSRFHFEPLKAQVIQQDDPRFNSVRAPPAA